MSTAQAGVRFRKRWGENCHQAASRGRLRILAVLNAVWLLMVLLCEVITKSCSLEMAAVQPMHGTRWEG